MGGVSASFAFIGDVVIAEPGALIGFAGPRVIEQTVRETLPEGFQRSEFLLEKGAIDMIVDRRQLRDKVARLVTLLKREPAPASLTRRSLDDWLDYISAQHPATIALGLDRVREVADGLDLHERQVATITVGGTNGKGSTCAMLERILLEAGYHVGLYTSPHLLRYNERVRIKARKQPMTRLVGRIRARRGRARRRAAHVLRVRHARARSRSSTTRALEADDPRGGARRAPRCREHHRCRTCAVVVSVDLDHQAFLGNDRESIGFEKAGIFRAGRPGDLRRPRAAAAPRGARARRSARELQVLGREFRYEAKPGQWDFVGRKGAKRALPMPALRGALAAQERIRGARRPRRDRRPRSRVARAR